MKILIADDEATTSKLLKVALSIFGECTTVESGESAYDEFIQAHGQFEPFSIITLDMTMGDLSGKETVERIRRWEREYRCHETRRVAKILMISGDDSARTIMKSFRVGAEGYIVKPIDIKKVRDTVQKLLDSDADELEKSA